MASSPEDTPRFAAALSVDPQSAKAEEQVVARIAEGLGGRRPDLLTVFVSHHHGSAIESLGPRLAAATGAPLVIGCTGEGIIGGRREVEQESALSLWAACLPGSTLRPFHATAEAGEDERPSFSGLPDVREPGQASLLMLADPFSFPTDEYLRRLNEEFPGVPAVGGMASGGMGPGQNLLINEGGLVYEGAVGVVLEGGVEVRSVVSQGCRPVGKPWVVTAADGHLVQKLGGKPAWDVLHETMAGLDERDRELFRGAPFVGLAIDPTKSSFERGDFLVRGIVGVQNEEKAIAIADLPRRGTTLQFLVRDADSAGEDLDALMRTQGGGPLAPGADGSSVGALLFSCNGRGSRMFETPDHDIGHVREGLAPEAPVAGFFAMGEIGPVGGRNFLHGFTASVAVFRPRSS